ncbi:MAG: DUF4416 family protein [Candidatus Omnitrophica bacterium]|nr:DUF4416 family protein [Candidatus Omnitrophota bacterium]MCM8798235.1 DUF4416 family protein [Candidatus Omnitrophota bacterium]
MGKIHPVKPVKLISGMIFNQITILDKIKLTLEKKFGEIDWESEIFPFDKTDYYAEEMGRNLKRKFLSFKRLIPPDKIAEIKIFTNGLEKRFSQGGRRQINLDPGYITDSKLVLATTKNYYHRIYLKKGIYGEVTLYFRDRSFHHFEYTYPDYRTQEYINFFNQVRKIYLEQIREISHKSD